MRVKIIFIVAIFFMLMIACTKNTTVTATPSKAVVESYIAPGDSATVKLTKEISYSNSDGNIESITGIDVYINVNGTDYLLADNNDGIYHSNNMPIKSGDSCTLHFMYNSLTITAGTKIPYAATNFYADAYTISTPDFNSFPPSIPSPVNFYWDNPNADYHTLVFKCIEANPDKINDDTTVTNIAPQTEPDQSNTQQVQGQQFTYYGKHDAILYTVLPQYVALFKDNSNSSQTITTIETNVINGLGIFTGIAPSDTLVVTVN